MKKSTEFTLMQFIIDVVTDIVVVFILVQLIRAYIFAPFKVHGPSMCDTFNVYNGECYNGDGEYILVSKFPVDTFFGWEPSDVKRGDVIVFQAPDQPEGEFYIKRVIGIPGDEIKIEDGFVYIKDETGDYKKLNEAYLSEENYGQTTPYRVSEQEFTVPDGKYFVMGDNRRKSSDSRRCFKQTGCDATNTPYLDKSAIQGTVKVVVFPLSHFRLIARPEYSI